MGVVLCQDGEELLFPDEEHDHDHHHEHHDDHHQEHLGEDHGHVDDHGHGEHDHDGVVADPDEAARGPYPVGVGPATTIVTYLGTDFILPNGCHLPKCEGNGRAYTFCRQDQLVLEKKYNDCLA